MTIRIIERVTRNAALGIRFWDVATGGTVIDGLVVEVRPRHGAAAPRAAIPNLSGVYVSHALPGLRDFEMSDATSALLWLTATRPFRIEVRDPLGRYLPMGFDADLPARGLLTWRAPWFSPPVAIVLPGDAGSPPQLMLERIPLFSAPSRPVPDPLAVVRAQLREAGSARAAAWTPLDVSVDGMVRGLGLSDADGRVAVLFGYPEPPRMALASPPVARNDFTWEVELTAYGAPTSPPRVPASAADLADVLAALATPRPAIVSLDSPGAPLRLAYREELIARTAGATGDDASYLSLSA